jgi:hypothetical protein
MDMKRHMLIFIFLIFMLVDRKKGEGKGSSLFKKEMK